jgi:hypothetical protein
MSALKGTPKESVSLLAESALNLLLDDMSCVDLFSRKMSTSSTANGRTALFVAMPKVNEATGRATPESPVVLIRLLFSTQH